MNELFEKIYAASNIDVEKSEQTKLFEQIYTEAEMLNEMNPKLRALLAAGLIGTASLGAASCSMPTDDPTVYEQPAPETPGEENPDNPDDTNEENPDDTNEENQVSAWEELGIEEADWNNIIAPATKVMLAGEEDGSAEFIFDYIAGDTTNVKKYIAGSGFVSITPDTLTGAEAIIYYQRNNDDMNIWDFAYVIPGDQVQQFYAKGAKQP